jgi:hypothetical protein
MVVARMDRQPDVSGRRVRRIGLSIKQLLRRVIKPVELLPVEVAVLKNHAVAIARQ